MSNENREFAVKLNNVKKMYRLGQIGGGTLQGDLQSWWAKVRGKEDPNSIIGEEKRDSGSTFMALNGITTTIYRGEAVGIIGSNGAGKSTLLKLLSRVTAPSAGEIDIYGRVTSMLEVGTGFHPELTGRENVYMNGAILGMTRAEIDEKMEEIVEFSEVRKFIDTPVKRYSSGMYVKLAFSVAAHLTSEIMIMDEVLAVGDMAFQKKCLNKMRDAAKQEGRTVLYVSHNMNTIRQLCDRCIVLDKGKVIFEGSVEDSIAVYLKQNNDKRISYDYSGVERFKYLPKKTGFLQGLDILERKTNQIITGEDLKFAFHCKSIEDFDDVKFRFEIYYSDGSTVGTIFSDKPISSKKGEVFDLIFSMSTKNLPAGRYYCIALAYQFDSFGNQIPLDRVENALAFEVLEKEENLLWLHQYWGHVKFDDMIVTEKITK